MKNGSFTITLIKKDHDSSMMNQHKAVITYRQLPARDLASELRHESRKRVIMGLLHIATSSTQFS